MGLWKINKHKALHGAAPALLQDQSIDAADVDADDLDLEDADLAASEAAEEGEEGSGGSGGSGPDALGPRAQVRWVSPMPLAR